MWSTHSGKRFHTSQMSATPRPAFFYVVLAFFNSIKLALPIFELDGVGRGWWEDLSCVRWNHELKLLIPSLVKLLACMGSEDCAINRAVILLHGRHWCIELRSMQIINGILQKSECLWQFQTKQPRKHTTLQIVINYLCGRMKRKAIFLPSFPTKKAKPM